MSDETLWLAVIRLLAAEIPLGLMTYVEGTAEPSPPILTFAPLTSGTRGERAVGSPLLHPASLVYTVPFPLAHRFLVVFRTDIHL